MAYGIRAPSIPLSPQALRRVVTTVDAAHMRDLPLRRVIPIPVLVAIDERALIYDAHLTYAVIEPGADIEHRLMGFRARACAYALEIMPPEKRHVVLDHVMSAADILRWHRELPVSEHERWRAGVVDRTQCSVFLPL